MAEMLKTGRTMCHITWAGVRPICGSNMPTVGRYGSPQRRNSTAKMYIDKSAIKKMGIE